MYVQYVCVCVSVCLCECVLYVCLFIFLVGIRIRSSLKLSKCNEWFSGFVDDWVNTACAIFQTEVETSSGETRKVRYF